MDIDENSYLWNTESTYVLVKDEDDEYLIFDKRNNSCLLIEDNDLVRKIIIKMLKNEVPVYESMKDFIDRTNELPKSRYLELIRNYTNRTVKWGNVSIIKIPDDKLVFLMEMKKIFSLSISTGILFKEVNTLPYIVVQEIHIDEAKKLISQTSFPECYKFSRESQILV